MPVLTGNLWKLFLLMTVTQVPVLTDGDMGTCTYRRRHGYLYLPTLTQVPVLTDGDMDTCTYRRRHRYLYLPTATRVPVLTDGDTGTCTYRLQHGYLYLLGTILNPFAREKGGAPAWIPLLLRYAQCSICEFFVSLPQRSGFI